MDVSVLAAVGSFMVSEWVLKPKATMLVILGCVLAYDLTTKTHDVASLRVYRGPALLAVSLMMCAYSLRTWRRNGVACDELLFLPGTAHGQQHLQEAALETNNNINNNNNNNNTAAEGDVAAGWKDQQAVKRTSSSLARGEAAMHPMPMLELTETTQSRFSLNRRRTGSTDDPLLHHRHSAWDGQDDQDDEDTDDDDEELLLMPPQQQQQQQQQQDDAQDFKNTSVDSTSIGPTRSIDTEDTLQDTQSPGRVQRWRENHPRITRIGTFFFFRTSPSLNPQNAPYAPSGPSVFGAALDLSMPILFNFHLFIEAYNHRNDAGETPAKLLPLIFLSVLIVRSFVPPSRRGRFWSTMKYTAMAPFHRVRFRDAFVGDVITSLVRPGQDILFALSYYITVIYGTVFSQYTLSESGQKLEQSWVLHNVILPSCALLPLWWKFLQTLREAYDHQRRWPYLGNALKYWTATLVILYGMTHPEDRRSPWWLVSFVVTLLYQLWWDVFMDWELLEIPRQHELANQHSSCATACCCGSSVSSSLLLPLQMYVLPYLAEGWRRVASTIWSWQFIQLRSKRLYKSPMFYWKLLLFNALTRFTWMLCFIPAYRLSSSGEEKVTTFSSDVNSYVGVLLPLTEILRRTFWGFLYLEKQTLLMMDSDVAYSRVNSTDDDTITAAVSSNKNNTSKTEVAQDEDEMDDEEFSRSSTESSRKQSSFRHCLPPTWLDVQQQLQHEAATGSSSMNARSSLSSSRMTNYVQKGWDLFWKHLFVIELSLWAIGFVGSGCWAAS